MNEPRPSITRFVDAVVRAELACDGVRVADAVQGIMTRLRRELGRLIGSAGFDVLLARSLALALRAHPVLGGITVGPGGTLVGLDDAARDSDALRAGALAIVAHFIELLIVLLDEDLAMRLVGDVWPALEEGEKT